LYILNNTQGVCTFTDGKVYEGKTKYLALYNKQENYGCLLRHLTETEKIEDFKEEQINYIINVKKDKKKMDKPYLFLFPLKSLEQADGIILDYHKGIDSIN